ncbi:oxygen-independent coproporphyrinogen III oxidase [Xylanimonas cellulosilytica DSM 15894]|uniref:Heme chaperone HemW n=1 Tax=Xylanimonas cellulosilytica (strain DSM 15894 / JCM 12276 / CECT 5975 / KCTC 9989 / LMG 20990 / NBRC 107835 / XIL07) TaxID=446471 RepID=D1BUX8_XYLCX|nr:radical SAM family heme chaperone HemW [Xylanimonas cellulosilytica]ACZ31217.1 oxygen-independent coproporphyrinogen III oxidase [Xylanimonas cellulosilytica DSM 15894]
MPQLPEGVPVPDDGALPEWVADRTPPVVEPVETTSARGRFGVYVHVPFCSVRCGYCDFNTYTASELGGGASQHSYATTALREVALAAKVLGTSGIRQRPVSTVFFGGGTPTMLPASHLVRILAGVRDAWGLAKDAEVTTEANPDSVTPESLAELRAGGFTRVSFGMQSAVPSVLATLERTHDPRRIPDVVRWARDAGLDVSLDLIYGTPGESLDDWRTSLETAIATGVDHVSAYALVVEPGTKMGAQVRRGLLPTPDEDDQATKYELADALLTEAGLGWYEVSNWSRLGHECRHNLAYWRGDDWWGIGPGAHSYIAAPPADSPVVEPPPVVEPVETTPAPPAGVRWWNVKHPRRYAALLEAGTTPAAARELLTHDDGQLERVMLQIRLREGLPLDALTPSARRAVGTLVGQGLLDGRAALGSDGTQRRALLTLRGRLLADAVVRALTD